jgi:hypothetical protein
MDIACKTEFCRRQPVMDKDKKNKEKREFFARQKKAPAAMLTGLLIRCLTMTYSHMGMPHTTIGDAAFHF